MWEERPEYQKAQAKALGAGLLLLLLAGIGYCISERNWELLKQLLIWTGALVLVLAVLSGTARLMVALLTRRHRRRPPHPPARNKRP